jgi:hypothetical protein
VLSGVVGHIKWGHYTAAAIHGYAVAPTNKRRTEWVLDATVVLADAFKMAQTPLRFIAKHAKGEWEFPIVGFARRADGHYQGRLTATLGAPRSLPRR